MNEKDHIKCVARARNGVWHIYCGMGRHVHVRGSLHSKLANALVRNKVGHDRFTIIAA